MPSSFHLEAHKTHLTWSRDHPPVLTVPSGSTITLDLPDGGGNQITPANARAGTALRDFDLARADPAVGPVLVEGAEPGDVLRVDVVSLTPAGYGWTAILPGFGLLADEFFTGGGQDGDEDDGGGYLHMWDLAGAPSTGKMRFLTRDPTRVIEIPYAPFLGIMGVAPDAENPLPTIPPYRTGGNLDCRHLVAGSTLYLPVAVAGALFSAGDGHAAQGDGEVCGTAIETPMRAELRLSVVKGHEMPWVAAGAGPHYVTAPRPKTRRPDEEKEEEEEADLGEYAAMGVRVDLREAARDAVRGLLAWLQGEKGLEREESYVLASVAASLKMVEVVDMPNYAVACSIPLGIFKN